MPTVEYHEPEVLTGTVKRMRVKESGEWVEKKNVPTYQADCSCGYRGPVRAGYWEADEDCIEHRKVENKV